MKKLISLLLVLSLVFLLCACGDESSTVGSTAGSTAASAVGNEGSEQDTDPDESRNDTSVGSYLTYDDLTETENFWLFLDEGDIQLAIDYPDGFRFENHGNGMADESSFYYSIVMAFSEQPMPDTSLEDAFYTLLNGDDGIHAILNMVNRASYNEVTPDTETVTLDSGREAILFSGTQHMDDYGPADGCPIRGYCTVLDDIPVIVCYIVYDEEGNERDRLAESARYCSVEDMEHYVEEMINTVRIVSD